MSKHVPQFAWHNTVSICHGSAGRNDPPSSVYWKTTLWGLFNLLAWLEAEREASALAKTQQTVHLGHLDVSPAKRAIAKYHWGNKQLEIGTGQEMDFIGELIKWTVLEGHNLDSDWILADIGVINVSHSRRCNLIPGVRAAV